MTEFKTFLQKTSNGDILDSAEMRRAMDLLLEGAVSDIEIAGFLMALRARGETVGEISAAAESMRAKALHVAAPEGAIDTCGTGGDGAGTFNISTATALVVAGCGVPVAKHGNKSASSKSGSAEVLVALGVKPEIPPEQISSCIRSANIGFMFAALHHKAVGNVANVRKTLGVRTMFNLLGPLSNPARARRQLMGVYAEVLVEPLANVLLNLGTRRAWVVHGEDGLDEITTTGKTWVAEVKDGVVRKFVISPEDAGIPRARIEDLRGGDPAENADAITRLLEGEKGPFRDICLLNAAAALIVADRVGDLQEGVELAAQSIDTGRAREALLSLVKLSNASRE